MFRAWAIERLRSPRVIGLIDPTALPTPDVVNAPRPVRRIRLACDSAAVFAFRLWPSVAARAAERLAWCLPRCRCRPISRMAPRLGSPVLFTRRVLLVLLLPPQLRLD